MTGKIISTFSRNDSHGTTYNYCSHKGTFIPFSHGNVKSITIIYTYKCPISCNHCCIECGPTRDETLGFDSARKCIIEAARRNCKRVAFSGGECLLFANEIIQLVTIAASLRLKPQVVTNAYWAVTNKRAKNLVKQLANAGLREIIISADYFHQEFIPLSNVLRAIEEAQKHEIHVQVKMVARGKHDVELDSIATEIKKHIYNNSANIEVHFANPVGRLRKHQSNYPYYFRVQRSVCKSSFNLSVFPSEDVYCCCSVLLSKFLKSGEPNLLYLENLKSRTLGEIIEIADTSPVLNALRVKGPDALLEIWGEGGNTKYDFPSTFHHICDFCVAVNKALTTRHPNLTDNIHISGDERIRLRVNQLWDEITT